VKRIFIVFFCLAFGSIATAKKSNPPKSYDAPAFDEAYALPAVDEASVAERIKISEKKRSPSNVFKPKMSSQLDGFVTKITDATTSEDYDDLMKNLEKDYATLPNDAKFFAAQALSLKVFRGAVYRVIPLLRKESRLVHSQLLTRFKSMISTASVMYPSPHVSAAVEYVASPYYDDKGQVVGSFNSEIEIQKFFATEVIPALSKTAARLEALVLTDPVAWDQTVVFGKNSFKDGVNRYKLIGEFEKNLLLANIYAATSAFSSFIAYNVNNTFEAYVYLLSLQKNY